MIKAVLLDLDNTLLQNDDRGFASAYLRLVGDYLGRRWQRDELSSTYLRAIRALAGTRDLVETNARLLLNVLCRETGVCVTEIAAALEDFHRDIYPVLEQHVQIIPEAAALVERLRRQGYAIAITTNPIYPAEAIRQRLAWAGLPDDFGAYALVTHAGIMRLTKADPSFYVEVAARIGVEPDEAVMVGDSLKNDIQPARLVGLHTYHVLPTPRAASNLEAAGGTLHDFANEIGAADGFGARPLAPDMIEPEMRGNLAALFGTAAEARPRVWQQHPVPDEWSPIQIVCHLLEAESSVHRPRLGRILAEENPFLAEAPGAVGARGASACDEDGLSAAHRFAAERLQTLDWLSRLQPQDWHRPARHSVFGPTTLLEMAHFTAQHDRLHINQLCQTLGRCE